MKFTNHINLSLLIIYFKSFVPVLFIFGIARHSYAQTSKLSKEELRKVQIDSIFDEAESRGLKSTELLRYDYYFSGHIKNQLVSLQERLAKDSFETISLVPAIIAREPAEKVRWHLHVKQNGIHSRETLADLEKRFRRLMYTFLVDDYNGFSIAPVDVNALLIPDDQFLVFIKTLDNEPLFIVASDLIRKKSFDRAILAFRECGDRPYKEDTSAFQMGNALVATNEFVNGIAQWERARNLNPHYLEAFLKLGILFFENSHFSRSLYNFQKADALKPDDDEILYHISKCLLQLKRYNESYKYASRAVRLNPKNEFAKGVLDILKQPQIRKLRKQNME